jgi:CO/xanthine dehydrogenase FAD-binding subunit
MNSDIHGSAEYRAHLVAVLARRGGGSNRQAGELICRCLD